MSELLNCLPDLSAESSPADLDRLRTVVTSLLETLGEVPAESIVGPPWFDRFPDHLAGLLAALDTAGDSTQRLDAVRAAAARLVAVIPGLAETMPR